MSARRAMAGEVGQLVGRFRALDGRLGVGQAALDVA
jgi:hypothetical protein